MELLEVQSEYVTAELQRIFNKEGLKILSGLYWIRIIDAN